MAMRTIFAVGKVKKVKKKRKFVKEWCVLKEKRRQAERRESSCWLVGWLVL